MCFDETLLDVRVFFVLFSVNFNDVVNVVDHLNGKTFKVYVLDEKVILMIFIDIGNYHSVSRGSDRVYFVLVVSDCVLCFPELITGFSNFYRVVYMSIEGFRNRMPVVSQHFKRVVELIVNHVFGLSDFCKVDVGNHNRPLEQRTFIIIVSLKDVDVSHSLNYNSVDSF